MPRIFLKSTLQTLSKSELIDFIFLMQHKITAREKATTRRAQPGEATSGKAAISKPLQSAQPTQARHQAKAKGRGRIQATERKERRATSTNP